MKDTKWIIVKFVCDNRMTDTTTYILTTEIDNAENYLLMMGYTNVRNLKLNGFADKD
jgi:hypothetical protein